MSSTRRLTLGFVGAGTVGCVLASAFDRAGYPVVAVASRSPESARALAGRLTVPASVCNPQGVCDRAELVFLTVSDDAIADVAASIVWREGRAVVHCNGASSIDPLSPAQRAGADVGVFHPLRSIPTADVSPVDLEGTPIGLEASSDSLRKTLESLARSVGGVPFVVRGNKTIYHASAVIASNYLVALLDAAAGLWEHLGMAKGEGLRALLPLVRGTVDNLDRVGVPDALTGPIARGDVGTVTRHLEALTSVAPEVVTMYKEMGRATIRTAVAKGTLPEDMAEHIRHVLDADGEA